MELITILNRCHRFRGFVYHGARFSPDHKSIEVSVRPRKGSAAICSRCRLPAPGYDKLDERRFEFIPLWGYFVFLLYTMRRVDCRRCDAVVVEEVPWGNGKHTLTNVYMLFLAPLGSPPLVERNCRGIPHFLGKGFRRGRACRRLRPGTPRPWPDRCHRRR
jgi:transposase